MYSIRKCVQSKNENKDCKKGTRPYSNILLKVRGNVRYYDVFVRSERLAEEERVKIKIREIRKKKKKYA